MSDVFTQFLVARNQELSQIVLSAGFDHHVFRVDSVDSTMRLAREASGNYQTADGFSVIAAEQTAGRGRGKKVFSSPRGGYYGSSVLRCPADRGPKGISLVVGLCLAEAIEQLCQTRVYLKWPNDVLSSAGAKVAGVLIEVHPNGVDSLISVGVGVNIESAPKIEGVRTASLHALSGRPISVEQFAQVFLPLLLHYWRELKRDGLSPYLSRWEASAYAMAGDVRVTGGSFESLGGDGARGSVAGSNLTGKMVGLDSDGFLKIRSDNGLFRVITGTLEILA